eukprot:TRINITY_DN437_c0_g1_i10.p1 TRINITY_DN437_c0_g1~~TRINITY_DN437_c0_g1_i10.p1  ORF type:complete len:131 (+),score=30.51 TRINITY_DN437_c0_g1_i10:795-1187(+)
MLPHEWMSDPVQNSALCLACNSSAGLSWCSRCKLVRYCSKDCQRSDWRRHKADGCIPIREQKQLPPSSSLSPSTTPVLQPITPLYHPMVSPAAVPFMPDFELDAESSEEEDIVSPDAMEEMEMDGMDEIE